MKIICADCKSPYQRVLAGKGEILVPSCPCQARRVQEVIDNADRAADTGA